MKLQIGVDIKQKYLIRLLLKIYRSTIINYLKKEKNYNYVITIERHRQKESQPLYILWKNRELK